MTLTPMSQRELKKLIARGPQPDIIDSSLWGKELRDLAWWTALKKCGLFRADGLIFHVSAQPFYVHDDPIWAKVRANFQNELAKSAVMPPAQLHSETSKAAARAIKADVGHIRQQVYELLQSFKLTDEEIAQRLGKKENTCRPRRIELVNLKLVHAVGTKNGTSGRKAQVWAAIEERKL